MTFFWIKLTIIEKTGLIGNIFIPHEKSTQETKSHFTFFRTICTFVALKLFKFVKQFMMDTFLLKLTQFEKTGSIRKTFISLGNLIINFHFRNQKQITLFVPFTLLLFDCGVRLPFNN